MSEGIAQRKEDFLKSLDDGYEVNVQYPLESPAQDTEGQVDILSRNQDAVEFFNVAEDYTDLPRAFGRLEHARNNLGGPGEVKILTADVVLLHEDQRRELGRLNSHTDQYFTAEELREEWRYPGHWQELLHSGIINRPTVGSVNNFQFNPKLSQIYGPEEI